MRAIRPIHAIIPALALTAAGFISLAQQAHAETRAYDLKGFAGINASTGIKVILKQGPFAVTAEEKEGRFDNLRLEVRNGVLIAGRDNSGRSNGCTRTAGAIVNCPSYTVTVSAPDISAIDLSSGASLEATGLSAQNISVDASSGSNATVAGSCRALSVDVSSGARVEADGLRCESASVDASSGARAVAWASKSASGNASSGGSVTFHGKPASFTKDTSSGGSVRTQ